MDGYKDKDLEEGKCPICGDTDTREIRISTDGWPSVSWCYECNGCGHEFEETYTTQLATQEWDPALEEEWRKQKDEDDLEV